MHVHLCHFCHTSCFSVQTFLQGAICCLLVHHVLRQNHITPRPLARSPVHFLHELQVLRDVPNIFHLLDTIPHFTSHASEAGGHWVLAPPPSLVFETAPCLRGTVLLTGLTLAKLRRYLRQLLIILAAAHERRVEHLDVHPPNYCIDPERDQLILYDWGNAYVVRMIDLFAHAPLIQSASLGHSALHSAICLWSGSRCKQNNWNPGVSMAKDADNQCASNKHF